MKKPTTKAKEVETEAELPPPVAEVATTAPVVSELQHAAAKVAKLHQAHAAKMKEFEVAQAQVIRVDKELGLLKTELDAADKSLLKLARAEG